MNTTGATSPPKRRNTININDVDEEQAVVQPSQLVRLAGEEIWVQPELVLKAQQPPAP